MFRWLDEITTNHGGGKKDVAITILIQILVVDEINLIPL